MEIKKIIAEIEQWVPPGAAWERDNVGLQVGAPDEEAKGILLALEVTEEVVEEAIEKNCNLIVTHHPFIFNPIKKVIYGKDPKSEILKKVIKNDINIYSAHTNLDAAKDGVNFELAKVLGLRNTSFLVNTESNQYKVVVFVPATDADKLSEAVFGAGGGIIGEYGKCSFRVNGTGTFVGSEKSNPVIGQKGNFEKVEETRIEVLTDSWKLGKVIKALLEAHPYEEPAYDIYPLKNSNVNFGFGVIGTLEKSLGRDEFLGYVAGKLGCEALRVNRGYNGNIKTVAVCGGSGSGYMYAAIQQKADAFITADVKYHTFEDSGKNILLVDAGHYETEIFVLDSMQRKLENITEGNNINIYKYSSTTNAMKIFKT